MLSSRRILTAYILLASSLKANPAGGDIGSAIGGLVGGIVAKAECLVKDFTPAFGKNLQVVGNTVVEIAPDVVQLVVDGAPIAIQGAIAGSTTQGVGAIPFVIQAIPILLVAGVEIIPDLIKGGLKVLGTWGDWFGKCIKGKKKGSLPSGSPPSKNDSMANPVVPPPGPSSSANEPGTGYGNTNPTVVVENKPVANVPVTPNPATPQSYAETKPPPTNVDSLPVSPPDTFPVSPPTETNPPAILSEASVYSVWKGIAVSTIFLCISL